MGNVVLFLFPMTKRPGGFLKRWPQLSMIALFIFSVLVALVSFEEASFKLLGKLVAKFETS